MATTTQPRPCSVASRAAEVGVSTRTLWRDIACGSLKTVRIRKRTVILEAEWRDYLMMAGQKTREGESARGQAHVRGSGAAPEAPGSDAPRALFDGNGRKDSLM